MQSHLQGRQGKHETTAALVLQIRIRFFGCRGLSDRACEKCLRGRRAALHGWWEMSEYRGRKADLESSGNFRLRDLFCLNQAFYLRLCVRIAGTGLLLQKPCGRPLIRVCTATLDWGRMFSVVFCQLGSIQAAMPSTVRDPSAARSVVLAATW